MSLRVPLRLRSGQVPAYDFGRLSRIIWEKGVLQGVLSSSEWLWSGRAGSGRFIPPGPRTILLPSSGLRSKLLLCHI